MRSNSLNSSNHDESKPIKLSDVDLILELDNASISAVNYKLNRILLYITDTAIAAIVLLLIYLTAVGSLPFLICLASTAALALTSFTNHITSQ